MKPENIRDVAIAVACNSPCMKSKRGAVAFTTDGSRRHTAGWNHPVVGSCSGSEACRAACRQICVHAEQVALIVGLRSFPPAVWGAGAVDMLHIKVVQSDDDAYKAVPSGPPSCAECSKLMLAASVAGMWLLHEDGWRRYDMHDFHEQTLRELGLP